MYLYFTYFCSVHYSNAKYLNSTHHPANKCHNFLATDQLLVIFWKEYISYVHFKGAHILNVLYML